MSVAGALLPDVHISSSAPKAQTESVIVRGTTERMRGGGPARLVRLMCAGIHRIPRFVWVILAIGIVILADFFIRSNISVMPIPCFSNSHRNCTCEGENMCFTSYYAGEAVGNGLRFDCKYLQHLKRLNLTDDTPAPTEIPKIDSKKVVFVTYSSSNHFRESRKFISALRNLYDNKIVYYDLGLTIRDIDELRTVCNLEYRLFNFSRYPDHVRNLMTYAFKPIILAEVYNEFEYFWSVDSSFRITDKSMHEAFLIQASRGTYDGLTIRSRTSHSNLAVTEPGMYHYLPVSYPSMKKIQIEANSIFVYRSEFAREAIKWHYLCGLTKDCITPEGAQVFCYFKDYSYIDFFNFCHRFDQSSLNLVTRTLKESPKYASLFGRMDDNAYRGMVEMMREDLLHTPLHMPCRKNSTV